MTTTEWLEEHDDIIDKLQNRVEELKEKIEKLEELLENYENVELTVWKLLEANPKLL